MKPNFEAQYLEGIHGIIHAYRVLQLATKISEAEGLTKKQTEILSFCAIFHDIGRINDGIDNYHGKRSIATLKANNYFGLFQYDTDRVNYIIGNHCITDNLAYKNVSEYNFENQDEAVYLLKVFKDSDNLDRVRLGDFDASYLRCTSSLGFVNTAYELCRKNFSRFEIITEFEGVFEKLKDKI